MKNYICFTIESPRIGGFFQHYTRAGKLIFTTIVPGKIYRTNKEDVNLQNVNVLSNLDYIKRVIIGKEKVIRLPECSNDKEE